MGVRQTGSGSVMAGAFRRPDTVWRLRRSPLVRAALSWVTKVCAALLAVVFLITVFFVWAFGHPLAWSVIGCLFAVLPLVGLVLALGVGLRAAVAAGPGRVAVRFFGRWRVVDLGQVRAVRLGDQSPFGGFGFRFGGGGPGGPGGLGGFGAFGGFGGPGPAGPGGGGTGAGGRSLVFEDVHGQRVEIGIDALDAGLAAVVRDGLAADAVIDVDAARALGTGFVGPGVDTSPGADEPEAGAADPGSGHRP
jgi:hypothetical protein